MANTPKVAAMEVYPVAGKDCMELNLSGAHAPYFTRNIVVLTDDRGNTGIGEVPGGQKITRALENVKHLVEGTSVADYKMTLRRLNEWLTANIKDDVRGQQNADTMEQLNAEPEMFTLAYIDWNSDKIGRASCRERVSSPV